MTSPAGRTGPWLAAGVALLVSLPALALPFLADDWANLADVAAHRFGHTAFGYFRPLYLGSLWLDARLWGRSAFAFHAANVAWITLAAALVVAFARRCGASPAVASLAGVLFALHPYHVENAAWVASRADALCCVGLLLAFLAYDRWARAGAARIPLLSIGLFEIALLCKEAAVSYPLLLPLIRFGLGNAPVSRRELRRGIAPHALVALVHFLWIRPVFLGQSGLPRPADWGMSWLERFVEFVTASVLPLHIERIERAPLAYAALAGAVVLALAYVARRASREERRFLLALCLAFGAATAPSLLSFQARYLFFPSVFSSLLLARVFLETSRRSRMAITVAGMLAAVWGASLMEQWSGWIQAGRVSRSLVSGLTAMSLERPGSEIVVANMPYRVHGAPVTGAFPTAVEISGGRPVTIRAAVSIDLADDRHDGVVRWSGNEVHVSVVPGVFERIFLPLRREIGVPLRSEFGVVTFDGPASAHVRIDGRDDGTRLALVWKDGALRPMF